MLISHILKKNGYTINIIVLGGFGFIGSRLVHTLKNLNYDVQPISRKNGVDLANYSLTEKCFDKNKPDVIINCAAHVGSVNYVTKHSADIIFDNTQIALNIYQAASVVCPDVKIINPLSNCSYPGNSDIQKEEEWLSHEVHESVFSYGNSKRIIYLISKCYNNQYGINTINFLIPNTFGPGDSTDANKTHALNGMIMRMLEAHSSGDDEFVIWGSGKPVREWAYVNDVVNILIEGINLNKDFIYPINLAQNSGYSIKESAIIIKEILGYKGKLVFDTNKQDGAPVKILNNDQFKKVFPSFKFFNHKKGINNTVNYYKKILGVN
jgi:GDP-L-fucose synthase